MARRSPTRRAQPKIFSFAPPAVLAASSALSSTFSNTRGTAAMKVGETSPRSRATVFVDSAYATVTPACHMM